MITSIKPISKDGKRLLDILEAKGMTIDELVTESNLPRNTIFHYLRGDWGEPKIETVKTLSVCLGIDFEDLFQGEVEIDDQNYIDARRYLKKHMDEFSAEEKLRLAKLLLE